MVPHAEHSFDDGTQRSIFPKWRPYRFAFQPPGGCLNEVRVYVDAGHPAAA